MDWNAVSLELGLLVLAVLVLAWDLTLGHGPKGRRQGSYVITVVGLVLLLLRCPRLPVGVTFTDAFVLDEFALFVKQVILMAGLLSAIAAYPYAERRGWLARSGEFLNVLVATGQTLIKGSPLSRNGAGLLKLAVTPATVGATSEEIAAFSDEAVTTSATTLVRVRVA